MASDLTHVTITTTAVSVNAACSVLVLGGVLWGGSPDRDVAMEKRHFPPTARTFMCLSGDRVQWSTVSTDIAHTRSYRPIRMSHQRERERERERERQGEGERERGREGGRERETERGRA